MKNIYVDTGELSEKLLNRTIEKMEVAKKKMGYNYSADAFLEVAISMAKYNSPTGRQRLFNADFAEMAADLYGDIEGVLEKLQEYRAILHSGPEALVDIDKAQKNEITTWWTRTTYRISSFFCNDNNTGEDTVVIPQTVSKPDITEEIEKEYQNYNTYSYWGISQSDIEKIINSSSSVENARRQLQLLLKEKLDQAASNHTAIDISQYPTETYYDYYGSDGVYYPGWGLYEIIGGCTWFAFNRYREMNNMDLVFRGAGGGNAQDWNDRIDGNSFTKINTKDTQADGIVNAVAVDDQGTPINGVYYGHVVYVEAIIDGDVYITEGWYSKGAFHQSGVSKLTYEEFANQYETIIVAK